MPLITAVVVAAAGGPMLLAAARGWGDYTVRAGDTIFEIAANHRTDVRTLVRANHLSDGGHLIRAGAKIRVPGARATAPRKASGSVRMARYAVRSGDTVGAISRRFGVAEVTIRRANKLNRHSEIYVGQHLSLPTKVVRTQTKRARSAAASVRVSRYTVRSGDTVSAIAQRSRSSIASILKANRLTVASRIQPGQVLAVPTRGVARSSANSFAGRTYASSIVNAAAANRRHLASRAVPSREATRALIARTARRYGVDPALAVAISYQESGWNQRRVSVANAIGAMQVIPSSGRWASELVGRPLDLLNTRDNITAGVVILKALNRSAASNDHAIAGYYQGLSSVQRRGMFTDTKSYVRSVRVLRARFA